MHVNSSNEQENTLIGLIVWNTKLVWFEKNSNYLCPIEKCTGMGNTIYINHSSLHFNQQHIFVINKFKETHLLANWMITNEACGLLATFARKVTSAILWSIGVQPHSANTVSPNNNRYTWIVNLPSVLEFFHNTVINLEPKKILYVVAQEEGDLNKVLKDIWTGRNPNDVFTVVLDDQSVSGEIFFFKVA
jgi:hypothetical protein